MSRAFLREIEAVLNGDRSNAQKAKEIKQIVNSERPALEVLAAMMEKAIDENPEYDGSMEAVVEWIFINMDTIEELREEWVRQTEGAKALKGLIYPKKGTDPDQVDEKIIESLVDTLRQV